MLYGMDENDELSLVKKEKLNIKKVFIVAIIIIIAFSIVFLSFYISNKIIKKHNANISVKEENIIENNIEDSTEENIENNIEISVGENLNLLENNDENKNISISIPLHDMNAIKSKFIPQYNENAQAEIKSIYYSDEKQVYLTFDDGPTNNITPQILDILKENDVKATFFVLGYRVELAPDMLKREYDEGHYIANHGYSHEYSKVYQSKDTVFQEYIDCENAIRNALGIPEYNTYLFRFPGGSTGGHYSSIKAEAREWLSSNGIAYTNWNCLTGDAENKKTKEACIEEMIRTKGNQNSIILLMHDASDKTQTVEALPEIIQYYKNEGYTFKTFSDIFE